MLLEFLAYDAKLFGILKLFTVLIDFLSCLKPETSFIKSTPFLILLVIIVDFLVSIERAILLYFFEIFYNKFNSIHSILSFTVLEPGLVDSPPTSIILAPEFIKFDM